MSHVRFLTLAVALAVALTTGPAWAGTQNASGTAVSTIITRAQQEVNDSSGNFFTEAEAIRWINEAVEIIASAARCIETSENATLYSGQFQYSLSTAHYDIETLIYDSGVASDPQRYTFLNKVDPKEIFLLAKEKGRPTYWWEWNNRLMIWPVPGAAQNATAIEVYMISKPTVVTATTDNLSTPYYYDNSILLYLKAKYYDKDRRVASATHYYALFDAKIAFYRSEVRKNLVPPAPAQ